MNDLFDIVGGRVVISNAALSIPPIKKVWDSNKDKDVAYSEISYIVLKNHPRSPYVISMYYEDRDKKLRRELFDDKWSPSEELLIAEKEYIELSDTLSLKLLRGLRKGLENASKYLLGLVSDNMDMRMVKDILDNASKADKAIKAIDSLERQVIKDELNSSTVRGGSEIGHFEIPGKKVNK